MSAGAWIKRHWRGELPLAVSFWGGGILAVIAKYGVVEIAGLVVEHITNLYLGLLYEVASYGSLLTIWVCWGVGTWRSATRQSRIDRGRWLGRSAKVVATLVMLGGAYDFVVFGAESVVDTIIDISGDPYIRDNGVRVIADGAELEVYGTITRTVSRVLDKALEYGGPVMRIRFDSKGGRSLASLEIKRMIEARGLDTLVENECSSACIVAFLGGRRRWATPNARMGFHRFYDFMGDSPEGSERYRRIMVDAGIAPGFLDKAFATPSGSLWYPSLDELLAAGVITGIAPKGDGLDRKDPDHGPKPDR